jgi:hypothetical protein
MKRGKKRPAVYLGLKQVPLYAAHRHGMNLLQKSNYSTSHEDNPQLKGDHPSLVYATAVVV